MSLGDWHNHHFARITERAAKQRAAERDWCVKPYAVDVESVDPVVIDSHVAAQVVKYQPVQENDLWRFLRFLWSVVRRVCLMMSA